MTDKETPEEESPGCVAADFLIGIPLLLLIALVGGVTLPIYWIVRWFRRSMCPRCHLPLACKRLGSRFDHENVKFNIDHHLVSCRCRWCRHEWEYEELRDPSERDC